MADSDKYPVESDRRRFVKGVVGSAALAGVGVTSAMTVDSLTTPAGAGGGPTKYRGNERVGGPAPRGMPQIPLEIDDEGYIKGVWPEVEMQETPGGQEIAVAEKEIAGFTYSTTWFQYCGSQTSPAVEPTAEWDNYFRYAGTSNYDWQNENVEGGDKIHVDDFDDYQDFGTGVGDPGLGKPAQAEWRSQRQSGGEVEELEPRDKLPVQIIRSPEIEEAAQDNEWLAETTEKGFIANLNQCTHFCCVPGFQMHEGSAGYDAENLTYCNCHQSVYDPFNIVEQQFVALPRPDDSVGGQG
jgi:Rieske Fe-S protein